MSMEESTTYADQAPDEVFQLAIDEGTLSRYEDEPNYAGRYMYMYSQRIGPGRVLHAFKDTVTRRTDVSVVELV